MKGALYLLNEEGGIEWRECCFEAATLCEDCMTLVEFSLSPKHAIVLRFAFEAGHDVTITHDDKWYIGGEGPVKEALPFWKDNDPRLPKLFDFPAEVIEVKYTVMSDWDENTDKPVFVQHSQTIPRNWVKRLL